jgi:hypothetical protein
MKHFILLFLLFNSIVLQAEKVGQLFEVNANDENIIVKSNLMTYYYARYVSHDGTQKSDAELVQRNTDKLTLDIGDLNLTWDGAVPVPKYDAPNQWLKFSQVDTDIGSYKGWENSKIEFQGGGLRNINNSWTRSKSDTIALGLLNLSVLPELVIKSLPKTTTIKGDSHQKVKEFTKKLSNIQTFLSELSEYYTLISINLENLETLSKAFSDDGKTIPKSIKKTINYFTYVKTLLDN